MGITVLPPDVNESTLYFNAVGDDIRFGLGAVRNVGEGVVEGIVAARKREGAFASFHDFLKKVPLGVANKRTVESLIKSGGFDTMGVTRRAMLEIHEDAVDGAVSLKRNEANGQVDLFGDIFDDLDHVADRVPDRPEWGKQDKLAFEREMLGLYVSDHPLSGLELELAKHATHQIQELNESVEDGDHVAIAGLVTSVQHRVARNSGNPYGIIAVEDFSGELEIMVLGKTYTEYRAALVADQVVVVRGRAQTRDDSITVRANQIETPDVQPIDETRPLELRIPERRASMTAMRELRGLLERHAGPTDVRIALQRPDVERVFAVPLQVRVSSDLFGEIKSLLGPASIA